MCAYLWVFQFVFCCWTLDSYHCGWKSVVISTFLNVLTLVLWLNISSTLENGPCFVFRCCWMKCSVDVSYNHLTDDSVKFRLPWWLRGKESACNMGDLVSIPGLWRSPGRGHGNALQYSCLENSMDRGAWGLIESDTTERLSRNRRVMFDYALTGFSA